MKNLLLILTVVSLFPLQTMAQKVIVENPIEPSARMYHTTMKRQTAFCSLQELLNMDGLLICTIFGNMILRSTNGKR
jgi:hypothetical protein